MTKYVFPSLCVMLMSLAACTINDPYLEKGFFRDRSRDFHYVQENPEIDLREEGFVYDDTYDIPTAQSAGNAYLGIVPPAL